MNNRKSFTCKASVLIFTFQFYSPPSTCRGGGSSSLTERTPFIKSPVPYVRQEIFINSYQFGKFRFRVFQFGIDSIAICIGEGRPPAMALVDDMSSPLYNIMLCDNHSLHKIGTAAEAVAAIPAQA